MVKLPELVSKYKDGLMPPGEQVEMIQILLDTELIAEYPEFDQLANYYVKEGLCYYVPINIVPELKE